MTAQMPRNPPIEFHDLDQKDVYDKAMGETDSEKARNFVVEFNHQQATIAFDLSADDFRILLGHKPPDGVIRWINVWSPSTQRPAVECIGTHYNFSPRLQALMTSATKASMRETTTSDPRVYHGDVEAGSSSTEAKSASPNDAQMQMSEDIEIYQLVKETMNYTSIDHGKQFLCIGANWLHRRPINTRYAEDKTSLLPPKHWSWLTLCSDSVVLSLHETPPYAYPENAKLADEELRGRLSDEVKISSSARGRFERLEDRLQLLMLNTMHEYLDELDALSNTYFNLTAQKDFQATARLSRSATLLAKLSVFFLPISFMTSYFSVEIPGLVEHYTPKMYWISFAVIAGLSFVSLFFFSRMLEFVIDVLEGWADSVSSNFLGIREPGERNDD
ncbi:ADP-ribosylation factor [Colletotrichum camelliae]|nr:ADP-ribosylation factor [Colletotrichum camelliae]